LNKEFFYICWFYNVYCV